MNPRDLTTRLTPEYLRSVLSYDKDTGLFTWLISPSRTTKKGSTSGNRELSGVIRIHLGSHKYLAHRLAFLYMNGVWPQVLIDHKDRNRSNNRWSNLREATYSQNRANSLYTRSYSGIKGMEKCGAKWKVYVRGKYVGVFKSKHEARSAYEATARPIWGEFLPHLEIQ